MFYKFVLFVYCFALISVVCRCDESFDVNDKCASNEKCVDDKIYDIVEKIDNAETISLIEGLEIVKLPSNNDNVVTNGRDASWWDWLQKFIQTHSLRFTSNADSRSDIEEGRTRKLKKFMIPLLILLKLKLALILPTILSTIALIAIKGLFAGVFALILSGITALKSFGEGKQDKITAIVAPIPTDILKHHSDYGNRWSRLGQESPSGALIQGGPSGALIPQPAGPTSSLLTQAYAPDPSLDPYSAYAPYPTMINPN